MNEAVKQRKIVLGPKEGGKSLTVEATLFHADSWKNRGVTFSDSTIQNLVNVLSKKYPGCITYDETTKSIVYKGEMRDDVADAIINGKNPKCCMRAED